MPKKSEGKKPSRSATSAGKWAITKISQSPLVNERILGLGLLLFIIFGVLWWHYVYASPPRKFWQMVGNNLNVTSMSRHISQQTQATNLDQTTYLHYGNPEAVLTNITLTQKANGSSTVIKTEGIGTTRYDYSRYTGIQSSQKNAAGQPLDFSKILNVWGRTDPPAKGQPPQVQYLSQASLGLVPFVHLSAQQRGDIIKQMKTKGVYTINYKQVKTQTVNGRKTLAYQVSVNAMPYITVVKQVVQDTGLPMAENLDPNAYKNAPAVKATMYIDKANGQLLKLTYTDSQQTETYSDYGVEKPIVIPSKTIPIATLQQQIQSIQ